MDERRRLVAGEDDEPVACCGGGDRVETRYRDPCCLLLPALPGQNLDGDERVFRLFLDEHGEAEIGRDRDGGRLGAGDGWDGTPDFGVGAEADAAPGLSADGDLGRLRNFFR